MDSKLGESFQVAWTGPIRDGPASAFSRAGTRRGIGRGVNLWIISIAIFCVASLLGALNFITTTAQHAHRGMTLMRMPLTCVAWFTTAILGLLSFGVSALPAASCCCSIESGHQLLRSRRTSISGQLIAHKGGSPLLWQHLFWFFGHPEVYIAILPGMGVTSQFFRRSRASRFSVIARWCSRCSPLAFLGFIVWGHHMFMSGMSPYSALAFSMLTLSIGVPSAIKTFNWLGTLYRGARAVLLRRCCLPSALFLCLCPAD